MVTSDSLAAESIRSGGDFGSGGHKVGISGQPSKGTTANVKDISNATILDPAPDAEARQATEEWNESAILNTGLGQGKAAGRGPTWNIPDGSTSNTTQPANVNVDPSNADAGQQGTEDEMRPKGRNVHEGDFDNDAPNASFNNEIGTENDPARFAESQFEQRNARNAGDAGYARDMNTTDEGQFDALKEESA